MPTLSNGDPDPAYQNNVDLDPSWPKALVLPHEAHGTESRTFKTKKDARLSGHSRLSIEIMLIQSMLTKSSCLYFDGNLVCYPPGCSGRSCSSATLRHCWWYIVLVLEPLSSLNSHMT
jgi:hypothetical protein